MNAARYTPASRPTLHFLGVTTARSSIVRVFPAWARSLGLGECELRGLDFVPHDDPARYREAVAFLKADPLSLGALITTHKIDLYRACRDLFDLLDPYAEVLGETSCLSKREGRLVAQAVDPLTAGLALEAFLPAGHWKDTGAEALVLGAGGSALAITWHLARRDHGENRPSRILVANRSPARLAEMQALHARIGTDLPLLCHLVPSPGDADALVGQLPPGSLVINATGLGKDAPGSPLTGHARFPRRGYVWEFNYRGDLLFLEQARAQQAARELHLEDGWVYFLHGWARVIAEVFHREIPSRGPVFEELARLAAAARTGS